MTFTWKCLKKDLEKRSILENILPVKYNYEISSFKLIHKSDIPNESKFEADFSLNVCSEAGLKDFFTELEKTSSTVYNILHGDKRKNQKILISGYRKCYHNVRKRTKSGRQGEEEEISKAKTTGKNTSCTASIKFALKKTAEHVHGDDCSLFPLNISLNYNHNHSIESAFAVKYHDVDSETKDAFKNLFEDGHSASSAYNEYKNQLMRKHGADYVTVSADRAIMPDYKWVFNQHALFIEKSFGKINSPEAFQKAVQKINSYNEKNCEVVSSIKQTEDGETIVVVCDQLSKRVHKVLPQAGDIVYVDATSNLGKVPYLFY